MSKFTNALRRAGAALAIAASSLTANAALTTQLGFLIDASGSIGSGNFQLMRQGYAAALAALPVDGSIEVTIYTFASGTVQVVAPTVVTGATLPGIVAAVNGMTYTTGITATGAGISAIAGAMVGSANFSTGLNSIINMATDGQPNDGTANPLTTAINAAIAAEARGIDALTAEALGTSVDFNFLRDVVFSPITGPCNDCGVQLAAGSTPPNPMTSTPWVLPVNSFDDFGVAINAKVQAIINPDPIPEPGVLALVAIALVGAGAASRKRKA